MKKNSLAVTLCLLLALAATGCGISKNRLPLGDAKQKAEAGALLFVADRGRVLTFAENTLMKDEWKGGDIYLPIDEVVYGGAKGMSCMTKS